MQQDNVLQNELNAEDASVASQEPDYKDLYIRSLADYSNMKKRYDKMIEGMDRSVLFNVIKLIISPLYNDINRGVINGIDGCDLIKRNLESLLEKEDISIIGKDYVGKLFDTDTMSAVSSFITSDESKAGTVADVIEFGFKDNKTGNINVFPKVIVYNYEWTAES